MAGAIYLPDTSVWVLRNLRASVRERCDSLMVAGRLTTCHMVLAEYLNNAPDPQSYEAFRQVHLGLRWLDVTASVMDRMLEVHRELAETSQHRNFSLPDLIIAATAEANGVTMLHYDSDYDRIGQITGQPTEWVAPQGSL